MSAKDEAWRETFGSVLAEIPSERIFELHREVSREATRRYRRTTRYRLNSAAGVANSRSGGAA